MQDPTNRPGHLYLIMAGTFLVDRSGSETLDMWSAADPATFKVMQITLEQPGDTSQHGSVILFIPVVKDRITALRRHNA